ncbi:hypothetical protein PP629_gp28 [Streptomyces phage Dubu]|uniref:Uncharacterized protein n=1 Tax=Streptomyces phage Dubu TaxID=2591226 RepID=A0A514DEU6_9CAUD|nr:hypothetical protein PP629_gp28 [Streptomyces phage Dubu]QDH92133.1 hypothetical protein SEA_DUBU_28 [Streptomyces phage Dubu]
MRRPLREEILMDNVDRGLWAAMGVGAALLIALIVWAVASDDGRECLEYDTTVVTTVVNGKVGTGLATTCVKYAPEAK